jgi:hypothetical protein
MLIRLIISPADQNRSGANQMRQHLSFREHFRRGNARRAVVVAARQSGVGGDCCVHRRAAATSFAVERGAASEAFDVHLEDGGMMNQAVDDGDRHCLVAEHGAMPQ